MSTVIAPGAESVRAVRTAAPIIDFGQARRIAAEFGTPTLVVSKSALIRTYCEMKSALPQIELFFAAKANSDVSILRTLFRQGAGVDVCSYREMQAALMAGFSPDQMIHTHPCKTERNISDCYEEGLRWFTFDCAGEIDKLAVHAPHADLILRLAASSGSSRIDLSRKFGCSPIAAADLAAEAGRRGLTVRCLSFHVGSQCIDPGDFRRMFITARRVWDESVAIGAPLDTLDIGGGFPAPYRDDVETLDEYCAELSSALADSFGDLPIRLIAEPGRGLCAEAVTLITKVLGTSVRNGVPWYIIDDGVYGSFSGKLFDHADFPLIAEFAELRPRAACIVAGPTCDSYDVVATDQELPDLQTGELLLVPSMGAYTSASASGFNGLDIAGIVEVV